MFIRSLPVAVLCGALDTAHAQSVSYVGRIGAAAVVSVNGGAPQVARVGQRLPGGAALVALTGDSATFEAGGQRFALRMGWHAGGDPAAARVTLKADERGQFTALGAVNGAPVRFLVDTGATLVSLPAAEARRLGISYLNGQPTTFTTANGAASGYVVKLDTVAVGAIVLHNVDAGVIDAPGPALLGMSFLGRTAMQRDGDTMALIRRF